MRYELVLAPSAVLEFRALAARLRAEVRDGLERHLRFEPTKTSRSRIKRLRGLSRPQYRLRLGDIRVFYDVTKDSVTILAIITKERAAAWLAAEGVPTERGPSGKGEG